MKRNTQGLLVKAKQQGGRVAYSGVQIGIMKDPTTNPFPAWQIPKVTESSKSSGGSIKNSETKTDFLDSEVAGLAQKYNEELSALSQDIVREAELINSGEGGSSSSFQNKVNQYKRAFKDRKGILDGHQKTLNDLKTKVDTKNVGDQYFYLNSSESGNNIHSTVIAKNKKGELVSVLLSKAENHPEDYEIQTFNNIVDLYQNYGRDTKMNSAQIENILRVIDDNSANVVSKEAADDNLSKIAKNVSKGTAIVGTAKKGGYYTKSFNVTLGGNDYNMTPEEIRNALIFTGKNSVLIKQQGQGHGAKYFVNNVVNMLDRNSYNSYAQRAVSKTKGMKYVNDLLSDFNDAGRTKKTDDNTYDIFTNRLMTEVGVLAKPEDVDGIVDAVGENEEYLKFLNNYHFSGLGFDPKRKDFKDNIKEALKDELSTVANDSNLGYDINTRVTGDARDAFDEYNLRRETRKLIIGDFLNKLNVTVNISGDKFKERDGSGKNNKTTKYYSGFNLSKAATDFSFVTNEFSDISREDANGHKVKPFSESIKFNIKIAPLAFNDEDGETYKLDHSGEAQNNYSKKDYKTADNKPIDPKEVFVLYDGNINVANIGVVNEKNIMNDIHTKALRFYTKYIEDNSGMYYSSLDAGSGKGKEFRKRLSDEYDSQDSVVIDNNEELKKMAVDRTISKSFNAITTYYTKEGKLKDEFKDSKYVIFDEILNETNKKISDEINKNVVITKHLIDYFGSDGFKQNGKNVIKGWDAAGSKEAKAKAITKYLTKVLNDKVKVETKIVNKVITMPSVQDIVVDGKFTELANTKVNDKSIAKGRFPQIGADSYKLETIIDNIYNGLKKEQQVAAKQAMRKKSFEMLKALESMDEPTDKESVAYKLWKASHKIYSDNIWDSSNTDIIQEYISNPQDAKAASKAIPLLDEFAAILASQTLIFSSVEDMTEQISEKNKTGYYTDNNKKLRALDAFSNVIMKEASRYDFIQ